MCDFKLVEGWQEAHHVSVAKIVDEIVGKRGLFMMLYVVINSLITQLLCARTFFQ